MNKTVLVLGAGASYEVDLPVGATLKSRIAQLLTMKVEEGYLRGGDSVMVDCIRSLAKQGPNPRDINPLLAASRQIVSAMPQAQSIDNYLHQRRDDSNIVQLGKIAVVRAILEAERRSKLAYDKQQRPFEPSKVASTWFNGFLQLLTEGCGRGELGPRLSQLAVISFNYDRCFEHFLFWYLRNYYGLDDTMAASLAMQVEIYHPYGQVGHLRWNLPGSVAWSVTASPDAVKVDFGAELSATAIVQLAGQVKTFTEGADPGSSQIRGVRRAVQDAGRIIYLGFGYHDQNMKLLYEQPRNNSLRPARPCWGTAFDESPANRKVFEADLVRCENHSDVHLAEEACAKFICDYSRHFRFV